MNKNNGVKRPASSTRAHASLWELARSGDFRGGAAAARDAIDAMGSRLHAAKRVELRLIIAFCSMRQGHFLQARRELEAADQAASSLPTDSRIALRVSAWRAELAYFQGNYSDASAIVDRLLPRLEQRSDWSYVAFALRIRIAILLARTDYESAVALADRAIQVAEASGDDYVIVQVLNVLGAVYFDRATSKLNEPHARAHLSSLDPPDLVPLESDACEALHLFQRARAAAERAHLAFAAWYVAGNIERLEILLGQADRAIGPIRKRLGVLQARGATYDEIVARSNLAWGLRTLGRHREALHELDVALKLARSTGTCNVLLEFLEYDRSIVLAALGDTTAARASYRRYLQLVGAYNRNTTGMRSTAHAAPPKRPLEPFFLKRADRFILEHIDKAFTVSHLAQHCGVSWRTLEKAFNAFRGLAPVAHVRNIRLDRAHLALIQDRGTVAEIAARHGFRSSTTFALEYRKRFGTPPRQARLAARS
jgi:AraC-like DNA-binding protein/ATP/maltotriose-dependent transcriptional regulator MalT